MAEDIWKKSYLVNTHSENGGEAPGIQNELKTRLTSKEDFSALSSVGKPRNPPIMAISFRGLTGPLLQ
jgi:hypothetical protein